MSVAVTYVCMAAKKKAASDITLQLQHCQVVGEKHTMEFKYLVTHATVLTNHQK